ncbi:MAG: PRTRC system ParB family protein, partial [Candidatus Competibacteraceae bacterium]
MNAPLLTLTPAAAVALPFHPHDGQQALLPLDCLFVKPGFNPRQFFEDAELAALAESVRQQGVAQALWVRPQEDFDPETPRFWLIAGERRWRAAQMAGLTSVPVTIRVVGERHALLLADLENNPALRMGLSVAEEARFAQRFLAECDSDRDEAARLLGWSCAKLDARLLLLHATASVLDALTQRKIKTGHAELLAGLPPSTQDGTLARILRDGIPIADLKARIKSFALDLSTAIFDKTDCATCPHHSSLQAALFAEAVTDGRCQNRTCFAEKTQTALQARQTELQSEYATVFLDTERPTDTYTVLAKTGPQGVGEAQFTACQGCQHFAARLSTQPGREGVIQGPLCVNLTCHRQKVAAVQP